MFNNIYRPKPELKAFELKKRRLWQAAGRMRWGLTLVWWLIAFITITAGFTLMLREEGVTLIT